MVMMTMIIMVMTILIRAKDDSLDAADDDQPREKRFLKQIQKEKYK